MVLLFGTVPFHGNCETRVLCAMQQPLTGSSGNLVHGTALCLLITGEKRITKTKIDWALGADIRVCMAFQVHGRVAAAVCCDAETRDELSSDFIRR
jgi:hypothetical protein